MSRGFCSLHCMPYTYPKTEGKKLGEKQGFWEELEVSRHRTKLILVIISLAVVHPLLPIGCVWG